MTVTWSPRTADEYARSVHCSLPGDTITLTTLSCSSLARDCPPPRDVNVCDEYRP